MTNVQLAQVPQLHDMVPQIVGRYEIVGVLGRGGMASVYLGRTAGEAGFSRLFAIKVLHPHLSDEEGFVSMLLDEGSLAARLHHPNVVPIIDIGSQGELHYVAMEYVEGCSLQALLSRNRNARPPRSIVPIVLDTLSGLHAAHSLTDEDGNPMNLVHRDVSPHNVLVGVDGSARLTDFGVARAESRISSTRPGQIKGKVAFMSPEQIRCLDVDRRADVFSVGCLFWSALTGRRLFLGANDADTMTNILKADIAPPSSIGLRPPEAFDDICLKALERDRDKRWSTAAEMEEALREAATKAGMLGTRHEVADWVAAAFGEELKARRTAVRALTGTRAERSSSLVDSSPSAVSQQRSGLQKIPAVGASRDEVDVDISSFTPSSNGLSPVQTMLASPKRAMGVVGGIIAAALVAGVVGAWLVVRSVAPAATAPPSVPSVAANAAAPPVVSERAPPPVARPAPAAPQTPAVAAPVVVASPPQFTPARPAQPTWRPPPGGWHRPPPAAAPAPPTPAPENTPSKPQTPWDKDSPLPPQ